MKPFKRLIFPTATCALLLTGAGPALAQQSAVAEALFEEGRTEMAAGRFDAACAKFRESDKLDPGIGTKFNLADCEERRGKYATAWELFKQVEGKVDASDERHAIAKQRRVAIAPKVPKLKMSLEPGAPAGTVVRIGTAELGGGSIGLALPLDPGEHELVVVAPGHAERKVVVTLREGATTEVAVSPGARSPDAPAGSAPSPDVTADARPKSGGGSTLGYVVGGVGVAGLVVGGVAGALVLSKKSTANDHCFPDLKRCDQQGIDANKSGRTLGVVSTIGFVTGAVGIGLGAYLILSRDDEGRPQSALTTGAGASASGVTWVQSW